ncbi:Hpt domain-containing protein [Roseococcus sp. DSY-14]|uniref:Hpt domain-containing protein n=1 Tax=Roseococcus sp. DSY-14 TaxID=3369650 RepID=UPI00387A879D
MDGFDPGVIAALREDLPEDALRHILRTFEADLARLLGELVAAAQAGRRDAYLHAAHALAGAAGAVGLTGLEAEARIAMDPAQPEGPAAVIPRLLARGRAGLAVLTREIG